MSFEHQSALNISLLPCQKGRADYSSRLSDADSNFRQNLCQCSPWKVKRMYWQCSLGVIYCFESCTTL